MHLDMYAGVSPIEATCVDKSTGEADFKPTSFARVAPATVAVMMHCAEVKIGPQSVKIPVSKDPGILAASRMLFARV